MRVSAFVTGTLIVAVCVANAQAAKLIGSDHPHTDALKIYQTEVRGHFSFPARSWALGGLSR